MEVRWGGYSAPKAQTPLKSYKPPKKQGGIFGFLEHLAGDVRDTAVGLPMGIAQLATHPIRSVKQIGAATWHDWAPLIEGHPGEWWHNFTEHPLAPILDVAGFVTFGAGTAARGASAVGKLSLATRAVEAGAESSGVYGALARAGVKVSAESKLYGAAKRVGGSTVADVPDLGKLEVIGQGSKRTILTPGGPVVERHYHANPVVRMRQKGLESLGAKLAGGSGKAGLDPAKMAAGESAMWSNTGDVGRYELKGVFARMGGDARYVNKALGRQRADRAAAFKHSLYSYMAAAKKMYDPSPAKRIGTFRAIEGGALQQFQEHAMTRRARSRTTDSGLAKGYAYETDPKFIKPAELPGDAAAAEWTGQQWHDGIAGMAKSGNWYTKDIKQARRNADGSPRIVRAGIEGVDGWLADGAHGSKVMDVLWNKPTQAWKILVLAYSPRFFVNNVVGNSAMYFFATNPKAAVGGLYDAYRDFKHTKGMDAISAVNGGIYMRRMGHESAGLGGSELGAVRQGDWSRKGRLKQAAQTGGFQLTHKYAEDVIRAATMFHAVRRTPEYIALRAFGRDHLQAVDKALEIGEVRRYTRTAVNNVLGDYNYLSKTEQSIKKVVPFYTWDRAIIRHTREMVKDRPYEAAVLASIGESGTKKTLETLGTVPDFLKGAIPVGGNSKFLAVLGITKPGPGRKSILTTQGLNPYATVADLADAGLSIAGVGSKRAGETVGSQINPLLAGGVEWLSGASLLSGAPIHRGGGAVGNIYGNALENTTQLKLLQTLIRGAPQPKRDKPLLFKGDTQQQLLSLLGAPVKEYAPATAKEIYLREHPVPHKYRKRSAKSLIDVPGL